MVKTHNNLPRIVDPYYADVAYVIDKVLTNAMTDTETTIDELKERIAKTIAYLDSFTPAQIDGSEDREITLKMRAGELKFTGAHYLTQWIIPNFTFHCTTAYNILRHNGVEIGKRDFLGAA